MQNQDRNTKQDRILSIEERKNKKNFYINVLLITLLKQFFNCLETLEYNDRKKMCTLTLWISINVYVNSQKEFVVVMVMSLKSPHLSPVQREYFQLPYRSGYKVCNRYRIASKTLEDFGLEIDQRMHEHPLVWSNDTMDITAPKEQIEEDANKPFCCKFCGSKNFIKYGMKNKKQEYKCNDCNRRFVDNLYFEKLKANPRIICLTLDLYFKGVSLRKIADHLKQFHELKVKHTTVLRWIERYIEIMDAYVSQFQPKLGTKWHADEMMVNINGDWFYLWNIMDEFTRFHLASVISKERATKDARKAFQIAKKRSHGDKPRCIITDGLQSYNKAIKKEFHTVKKETIHISNTGIRGKYYKNAKFYNNIVERLNGTVRDRNKTQRGLEKQDSVFIKGHQLYYNFIRPHQGLNDYTPAHFSNIYLGLGDKKWENLLLKSVKNQEGK